MNPITAVGLAASLLIAVVFAVAGIAKLGDQAGTRTAVREFGVPASLGNLFALVLPMAELAVAVLLVNSSTRVIGALGAIALLAIFSVAIAIQVARGRAPKCLCFGQRHSEPVGWKTLARNGVFAVLAVTALTAAAQGDTPSIVAWIGDLDSNTVIALVLAVTLIAVVVAGTIAFISLLRAHGRVLLRLDELERRFTGLGSGTEQEVLPPAIGLEPQSSAPAFAATDTNGARISLAELLEPGLPLLLIFTSRSCGPCKLLLPKVAAWQRELNAQLTVAVASGGNQQESIAEAREYGLERVLVDHDLAIYEAYQASGTPSAVLITPGGKVGSYVAPGAEWIERLLNGAATQETDAPQAFVAAPAPDLTLSGVEGETVAIARLKTKTLLLFWNPGCGFCSSMHDDVLAWERHPPIDAPALVIVSSGDESSVRAEGFSSTVVLDPEFTVGAAFGIGGTPMAILIDGDGQIASAPAAGAEAVFTLAGGRSRGGSGSDARFGARVNQ